MIGHEISHSFDDAGAAFDSTGLMRNWWTDADLAVFKRNGKALADAVRHLRAAARASTSTAS